MPEEAEQPRRPLVVVANRLPIELGPDGQWRTSPGGLVSALEPALRGRDATWIGWPGAAAADDDAAPDLPADVNGLGIVGVELTAEQVEMFYEGFSNSALWPLYHDCVAPPAYHRPEFDAYVAVNRLFATAVVDTAPDGSTVWVHDYQLQLVPGMLRAARPDLRVGFFLHIPFPPVELFAQLPWRKQVLESLLGSDVVGFQTQAGADNFLDAVRRLLGIEGGDGRVDLAAAGTHRTVRVESFPIGIDAEAFDVLARDPAVQARAQEIRAEMGGYRLMLLGVDRLDYTKGIDVRIRAFAEALIEGLLDPDDVTMLQLAIPSRQNVDQYQRIRDEVELLVGRANGDLGRVGDPAIHYLHQSVSRDELVAMYVAADVLLVTPLRDGMNLVAKEYVASRTDDSGAVILSEFTGAAGQLREAFIVNPYDIEAVKRAMTVVASAHPDELTRRMRALRENVFREDVDLWVRRFLAALEGAAQ